MESNRIYTYIFKYSFCGVAVISISFGLIGYFIPNAVTINGQTRQLNETELLISLIVGLIFLIIFFILNHKFVSVDLGVNKVTINNFRDIIESNWTDVEFLKRIPFIKPPLYSIKLKNMNKTYLFTTQPKFFRVGNSFVDTSEMGNRISKMKRELEI